MADNNVTYLFGAGASFDSLPIVDGISEEMFHITNYLETYKQSLNDRERTTPIDVNGINKEYATIVDELNSDIRAFADEIKKHASIDTLAKKLYLKSFESDSAKKLLKLKTIICICFIIIQEVGRVQKAEKGENPIPKPNLIKEKRYDSFFASILTSISGLPKNVRILSWNYDHQFEIAFSEYYDSLSYNQIAVLLGLVTKKLNSNILIQNKKHFSITKLNGSTGFTNNDVWWTHLKRNNSYNYNMVGIDCIPLFQTMVNHYINLVLLDDTNVKPLLSFAWEDDIDSETSIMAHALNRTKDTDILVVIGYSFPYFNREIDGKIIDNMSRLRKVYIQDPNCEGIAQRFDTIYSKEIHPKLEIKQYSETSQFLFPNEL